MKLSVLLVIAAAAMQGQTTAVKALDSECPSIGGQPSPFFRGGHCFRNDQSSVRVYGPDGHFAFAAVPQVPGSDPIYILDVAADPGAGFVLAVAGKSARGLVLLDRSGSQTDFIPVTGFYPVHLAIAQDHSIWVAGDFGSHGGGHMLLHKYSATGQKLGSYLPFSSFPAGTLDPIMGGPDTVIAVGGGVVAVTARSGPGSNTANLRELIRMDESGKILTRTRMDGITEDLVVTADGVIYRCDWNTVSQPLYRFNPASESWTPLVKPAGTHALFGVDDRLLVYRVTNKSEQVSMQWYAQPALQ